MFQPLLYIGKIVCFRCFRSLQAELVSCSHVLKTRPHWITTSPAPSYQSQGISEALAPLWKTAPSSLASKFECAGECAGALSGRKSAAAGTFNRWSERWRRRARPWDGGTHGGGSGNGRQSHCLYSTPIAWPQVLQALQALWGSLIAHVEPQGLMSLAVVYDRLLIAVEGQCAHLVRDLFRWKGSVEGKTERVWKCDGEHRGWVEEIDRVV